MKPSCYPVTHRHLFKPGLTLIETLVVISIVSILAALTYSVVEGVRNRVMKVENVARMRSLGQGILLYSQEHANTFPRSWHSAGTYKQPGWARSIAPYLGFDGETRGGSWDAFFNRNYRAPSDTETNSNMFSYGLNVHFELDPAGEDYFGAPQTWRRVGDILQPSRTILLAQVKPILYGDHLMCYQWSTSGAPRAVLNHDVDNGRAHYLFVDGHVESLAVEETFDPSGEVNLWNPALAARH